MFLPNVSSYIYISYSYTFHFTVGDYIICLKFKYLKFVKYIYTSKFFLAIVKIMWADILYTYNTMHAEAAVLNVRGQGHQFHPI